MDDSISIVNKLLVEVFNDILTIEETTLKDGVFNDVSITEVHTIEAIGLHKKQTASEVAKKLSITAGTLTTATNSLVKKGYVERSNLETDRRVVLLSLTKRGRLLFRIHEKFHGDMIKEAISGLTKEEEVVLGLALSKVHKFFIEKINNKMTNNKMTNNKMTNNKTINNKTK